MPSISVIYCFFYHRRIARRKSIQQSGRCTLSLTRFFKPVRSQALIQVGVYRKWSVNLWDLLIFFHCHSLKNSILYSIWSMKSYGALLFPSDGTSQDWALLQIPTQHFCPSRGGPAFLCSLLKKGSLRVKVIYSSPGTHRKTKPWYLYWKSAIEWFSIKCPWSQG